LRHLVTHGKHLLAVGLLSHSGNGDVADWGFELDQGVCAIVVKLRQSFTIGAEVRVVADSALVAVSDDVGSLVCATRTVAIDASVSEEGLSSHLDVLIEGDHAVAWVSQG